MFSRKSLLLISILLCPITASAWWNGDWSSRKKVTIDASVTGSDLKEALTDVPVLVRLHNGNFGYFSEMAEDGKDVRAMKDDKTPLKFQIEKFDAVNEMALVWVKYPVVQSGSASEDFNLYYGNDDAPPPDGGAGTFNDDFAAVFHFDEKKPLLQDYTAYGNNAEGAGAIADNAGWIGTAARFNGAGSIEIKANPSLALDPAKGYTLTAWVKADQATGQLALFDARDGGNSFGLWLVEGKLVARAAMNGVSVETAPADLGPPGQWRHVGLIVRADKVELFLDGVNSSNIPVTTVAMNPVISVGGSQGASFFLGSMDELQISHVARPTDWMKFAHHSQSPDFTVVSLGQDESADSGGGTSSFLIIIQSVTIDGWVVIALTGVMFVLAMVVMVVKVMVLRQIRRDNKAFMEDYNALSLDANIGELDREESNEEKELEGSSFLTAMVGEHDHYQSSPLYHIYHTGVREFRKRLDRNVNEPISSEAIESIRAMLDSISVRETQKLNDKMVLLTICIAGGPFLGLLGTVVGVMITFAVIAASGDVNINSIAPGIAAALLATVAGLAVAIPSLFAYNYLLVQIKDILADMRVFADEFLAILTERAADEYRMRSSR